MVENFGKYWNKGRQDACLLAIAQHGMDNDKEAAQVAVRSLSIGHHHFLMMREHPGDKGGFLIRYDIIGKDYVSYRLNEQKRSDFERDHPKSPVVVTNETATIPVLNEESAALLTIIADDPSYWLENSREPYNPNQRKDCADEND